MENNNHHLSIISFPRRSDILCLYSLGNGSTRTEVTCVRVDFSIRYMRLHNQKNIDIEKLKCISLICSADHEQFSEKYKIPQSNRSAKILKLD